MVVSPLTGSSDIKLLKVIQLNKLIDDWQDSYSIDINQEINGHKEIYLYQCNQNKLNLFAPFAIAGGKYEQLQKFD